MNQVAHIHRIAQAHCHERQRQTDVGHQVAVHHHLHVLEGSADVGVQPVVILEDEFPILAGRLHIGRVVTVEGAVTPNISPVAEHHELGITHRAVVEVDLAVLERTPPVAAVARGVVGLVHFLVDALLETLLGFLDLALVLDGVVWLQQDAIRLLDDNLLR